MPGGMYDVKPFYDSRQKVELPNVMYSMQPVYQASEETNMSQSDCADPLVALERRQDSIFSKLSGLKQELDKLTQKYDVPKQSPTSSAKTQSMSTTAPASTPISSNCIHDIVISADPEKPPLSIYVLFELLKQKYRVLAESYTHSSVISVDPALKLKSGSQVVRGEHDVALTVIWKKVDNGPQLMISPVKQSVISGEVNVARYINRLLNPGFDTEDITMATAADDWLDTIDMQIFNGNSKQKAAALKSLNVKLKKSDWIVGAEISFVDIVMWSALHQSEQAGGAPENVQKWMKACANVPVFSSALTLVKN